MGVKTFNVKLIKLPLLSLHSVVLKNTSSTATKEFSSVRAPIMTT